jgi:DNA polymerase-3 subunit alpha
MSLRNIIACDVVMSTIINRCAGLIKERYGVIIDIYEIPQDDAGVYELMGTDTSTDVFGLRSLEYHRLISHIHPTEIRHIEALYAMSTRLMFRKFAEYIKNKDNSGRIEYYSNIEQTVLGETYGVLLYTDQIAELIHCYSGIPEDVSANIAKYIHKSMKPELSIWKSVFVVGTQLRGYTEEQAQQIWEWLKTEGEITTYRYIAESAAITSYQCFWLKTHYPNEYIDALVPLVNTDELW